MVILILGLALFLGVHSIRAVAPQWRREAVRRIGDGVYKGVYSFLSLAGFALIIWGFGHAAAESGIAYVPPFGLRHATYALMLPALVLAVASVLPPGYIRRSVRHPLLIGTALWAFAHLLVNGEIAAVVLFGAFLGWAVIELAVQATRSSPPLAAPAAIFDVAAVIAGLALYGLLVWRLHEWAFGVPPTA